MAKDDEQLEDLVEESGDDEDSEDHDDEDEEQPEVFGQFSGSRAIEFAPVSLGEAVESSFDSGIESFVPAVAVENKPEEKKDVKYSSESLYADNEVREFRDIGLREERRILVPETDLGLQRAGMIRTEAFMEDQEKMYEAKRTEDIMEKDALHSLSGEDLRKAKKYSVN